MDSDLATCWKVYCLPKRGHSAEEYEDAFAGDPQSGRFAIADGASESSFAALWARLLVQTFVQAPPGPPCPWAEWLPPLQKRWDLEVNDRPLPWYAEAKIQEGAFATFLGLVLNASRWQAVAVGDSCLFHLRGDQLVQAFPITRSEEFDNHPRLVGSRTARAEALEQQQLQTEGDWQANDWLVLMTDALAQWFLRAAESDHQPSEAVLRLVLDNANSAAFAAWIEQLRDREGLRNDDVTLVAVSLRRQKATPQCVGP
jgi:serine/threonine protein phosphatase PrpC